MENTFQADKSRPHWRCVDAVLHWVPLTGVYRPYIGCGVNTEVSKESRSERLFCHMFNFQFSTSTFWAHVLGAVFPFGFFFAIKTIFYIDIPWNGVKCGSRNSFSAFLLLFIRVCLRKLVGFSL